MQTFTPQVRAFSHWTTVAVIVAFGLVWTACDSTGASPGEEPGTPVTLSFVASGGGTVTSASVQAAGSRTYTDDDGNSVTVETAELVLSEIEFQHADASEACRGEDEGDDGDDSDDDSCEAFEEGPLLVELPLDSDQPAVVLESALPEGLWQEVEFEVDAIDRDHDDGDAFLDETGFPKGVSIRVTGTWTPVGGSAQSFTYLSDLEGEREVEFDPPLEVTAHASKNVTFRVDVGRWFRQSDGTLVNPAEGNDDHYEDLIEDNIENSIEGFEDDDRDGDEDDDDSN